MWKRSTIRKETIPVGTQEHRVVKKKQTFKNEKHREVIFAIFLGPIVAILSTADP